MENSESGFDVLNEINKKQLTIFVIIFTANGTINGCKKAWQNQAWDYIFKTTEDENESVIENIDSSIQIAKLNMQKGDIHIKDKKWVDENREELLKKYTDKFIAVLHREVVAFADTKDELIEKLLNRRISIYLTYIESFRLKLDDKKMTVFVEGPTDIKYLEKMIEIFEKNELKEKIKFDLVGDKSGQFGNGEQNMINAFEFLKENREFRKNKKVLLLFDNDVEDKKLPNKGKDYENIHIARMGGYLKGLNGIKGVETFLNPNLYEEGFEKGFIRKTITTYKKQEDINYKIIGKIDFCNWILENRADKKNFDKFQEIITLLNNYIN